MHPTEELAVLAQHLQTEFWVCEDEGVGLVADDDPSRVDRDWVWQMLSTEVYWHRWRTRAQIEAQLDGAWRIAGKLLVQTIIDDGPGAEFRWTLFTGDAHGLYEQFGFGAPDSTAMVRPGSRAIIS